MRFAKNEQQLEKKQGADFDRCFLAGQVAMHTDLLATLDVAKSQLSTSSQLTPVINKTPIPRWPKSAWVAPRKAARRVREPEQKR